MKYSIKIALLLLIIGLFISKSFGYLEENLYCTITSQSIRVSTQKSDDSNKCTEYIQSLEYLIKAEYKDVQKIQVYIDKKKDIEYRQTLQNFKKEKIYDLQAIRLGVIENMKLFEDNFLKKTQEYLQKKLEKYYTSLTKKIAPLQQLGTGYQFSPYIQRQITLITSQINTLNTIYTAPDIPTFLKGIKDYLYFKKLLEGN
ncbi:hypothetical protein K9M48_04145 [Candidatus Gracilibacteria bacterium]|nr:hypothetical protein [Candidatus Gracilibacteria bacterium]